MTECVKGWKEEGELQEPEVRREEDRFTPASQQTVQAFDVARPEGAAHRPLRTSARNHLYPTAKLTSSTCSLDTIVGVRKVS